MEERRQTRFRRSGCRPGATVTLVLASLLAAGPGHAGALPAGTCWATWTPFPISTPPDSYLNGVVSISGTDAWAVGYQGHPYATLTEHWDGRSWTTIPSPNGTPHRNVLYAVDAKGPDDVWAVGYQFVDLDHGEAALIEHWDGRAWSVVPAHAGDDTVLYGVKAFGPDDAWAVGVRGTSPQQTLTEHWDGTRWSVVPSPSPSVTSDHLYAVGGTSGSDVWAVGSTFVSGPTTHGLILHWDGTSWNVSDDTVGPEGQLTFLQAATAIAPGDAWAAGDVTAGTQGYVPALDRWNGSRWRRVPGPETDRLLRTFGIDAVARDDVWAVGIVGNVTQRASILRWDGQAWTQNPTHLSANDNILTAISLLPSGDGWAVGYHLGQGGAHGVALRACGA